MTETERLQSKSIIGTIATLDSLGLFWDRGSRSERVRAEGNSDRPKEAETYIAAQGQIDQHHRRFSISQEEAVAVSRSIFRC